jgi:hypothetical protein
VVLILSLLTGSVAVYHQDVLPQVTVEVAWKVNKIQIYIFSVKGMIYRQLSC